jgi:hypothetical protein
MNKTRVEANDLIRLLLGDQDVSESAARRFSEKRRWGTAVGLATAWRVIPQLQRRLKMFDLSIDDRARDKLKELSVAAAAQAAYVARCGARVLLALGHAGVPAVAFKGLGLVGNLYQGAAERMLQDCDILVSEESLSKTCAVLTELGFSPLITVPLDDWLRHIENRVYRTHGYIVFVNDDAVEIDLHWRLGTGRPGHLKAENIFRRSELAALYGMKVPVAAPLDAIALTAHHAIRSAFEPASTVKDMCDLLRWWEVEPGRWRIGDAVEHFKLCGLSKPVLALWKILAGINSRPAIVRGARQLEESVGREERAVADRFAELFWDQVEEGPVSKVLLALGVATPSSVWRFFSWRLTTLLNAPFRTLRRRVKRHEAPLGTRVGRLFRECAHLNRQRLTAIRALAKERRLFESSYEARDL